jgi:protein-S-isoprenylcysteine O-methyltransferase Ste14
MPRSIVLRMFVQTTLCLAAIGAVLFLAAGDVRWPPGWRLLAELGLFSYAMGLGLARLDPALLEARLSSPVQRDQKPWDRIFISAVGLGFVVWLAAMGVDGGPGPGPHPPPAAQTLGAVLLALCMGLAWLTFRANSFAAPQVRMQAQQQLASGGPYRVVRHPMYSAAILFFLGLPLLLDSWWGLTAAPVFVAALAARTLGEERMLRGELAGYDNYARRVRFRFAPGLW